MSFSNNRLSQNLEDDRGILMWTRRQAGVISRVRHAAGSPAFSPRCRTLARVAPDRRGRRIENRFLWNHRDPLTNARCGMIARPTGSASVVRRALVENPAACRAARRSVRHLGSQALSGPAPSPEGPPKN
jgi:hypothetical protein